MKKRTRVLVTAFVVIALIIVLYYGTRTFSMITGLVIKHEKTEQEKIETLAKCLTEKGVVMYGSASCPHCTAQKSDFGEGFKLITYVECTEHGEKCIEAGAQYVPMWKINNENYFGKKNFSELAQLSGCELD